MIIRECYVDDFGDSEDLSLEGLAAGLNVIRGASPTDVKRLGNFIPAMFLGETAAGDVTIGAVSGSLIADTDTSPIELVRLADHQVRGLHFLDAQGCALDDCELANRIKAIHPETYLALFTDRMSLTDRLSIWKQTGIIQELVGSVSSTPANKSIDSAVITSLLEQIKQLRTSISHTKQLRDELLSQIESGDRSRETYLAAKQQQSEAAARAEQLHESIHRSRKRLESLDAAITLANPWVRRAEVQAELERLGTIRVHPNDIKRVRELDGELEQLRQQLRQAREELKTPTAIKPPAAVGQLLQAESKAEQSATRIAQIEAELKRNHLSPSAGEELTDIRRLEFAADELDRAFSVSAVGSDFTDAPRLFAANELPIAEPLAEDEIDSMRGRVDKLKAETRQLLHGRVLSPTAILIIGALFSSGVAMILASLVFDFGGLNLSIGVIGISATVAATLLKVSFESPCRRRVAATSRKNQPAARRSRTGRNQRRRR